MLEIRASRMTLSFLQVNILHIIPWYREKPGSLFGFVSLWPRCGVGSALPLW